MRGIALDACLGQWKSLATEDSILDRVVDRVGKGRQSLLLQGKTNEIVVFVLVEEQGRSTIQLAYRIPISVGILRNNPFPRGLLADEAIYRAIILTPRVIGEFDRIVSIDMDDRT